MKHMSKIFALVLALVMVLSLATTASAYTITMAPSADGSGVAGHTYEVYQIYTGTMSVIDNSETLGEVKYGQDYAGKSTDDFVPKAELDEIAEMSGAEAAEHFSGLVDDTPIAILNDENNHTSADLASGYYLIIDVSENLPETETSSAFVLEVLDNLAINSKHTSAPITEKKIDDKNDSTGAEDAIVWQDSADHDIGDAIPFQLEMTVPSAFEAFKAHNEKEGVEPIPYRFVFHDTEEKGLSFNNDAVVYVDGNKITSGYTIESPATDGKGHTFDVIFEDMTAIESIKVGSKVTVEYTSTLTEDAVIGNKGNVNEVYGEYINFNEPEVPKITPVDTVIAFTYKVVVNKYNEKEELIAGAEFTLEKFVVNAEGSETHTVGETTYTGNWVAKSVVKTEAGKVFTFNGLDDGFYRLTETKAPDGYNKIDPVEFTVTAEHDILWETQDREDVLTDLSGDVTTGEIEFSEKLDEGSLSTDVVNQAGTVLPETGGIGTTIFYALGGLLVVAAVVLLVTKKRMASAK